jgi:hypothetical protein
MHLFAQPGYWSRRVTRLGWVGPAQPHGSSWTQPKKNNIKKTEREIYDFLADLFYGLFFIYIVKNINLAFRIPGF